MIEVCPVCRQPATYSSETEVLERYTDGSVGLPGRSSPDGVPKRMRESVPGKTVETWQPCGHTR